jgi:hypothetical protein
MFLGITIIGWVIVGLVYLPIGIALAVWAARRWREQRRSIVTVGVASLLPLAAIVAEAVFVNARFMALCEEVRPKIKRTVVVTGFYDDSGGGIGYGHPGGTLDRYDFIEWRDKEGRIWRFERAEPATLTAAPLPGRPDRLVWLTAEGKEATVRRVRIDRPTARYHYRSDLLPRPVGYHLRRRDEVVIDSQSGEVIATEGGGYQQPPFIDSLWLRYFDSHTMCPHTNSLPGDVLIGIHDKRSK